MPAGGLLPLGTVLLAGLGTQACALQAPLILNFCLDIPCRPDGLFPPGDALLAELGAQARTHAFEKHLAGRGAPAELLPRGSWASGNAAALAGLDLRLFYQVGAALPLHAGDVQCSMWEWGAA